MPTKKTPLPRPRKEHLNSVETNSFLGGLAEDLEDQIEKYGELTSQLFALEARVEVQEKMLCLGRDHFAAQLKKCSYVDPEFRELLNEARYAGLRLADACTIALKAHKKMTAEELLADLNEGLFRFKTTAPMREIHAALIKHSNIRKVDGGYEWIPGEQLRLSKASKANSLPDDVIAPDGEVATK